MSFDARAIVVSTKIVAMVVFARVSWMADLLRFVFEGSRTAVLRRRLLLPSGLVINIDWLTRMPMTCAALAALKPPLASRSRLSWLPLLVRATIRLLKPLSNGPVLTHRVPGPNRVLRASPLLKLVSLAIGRNDELVSPDSDVILEMLGVVVTLRVHVSPTLHLRARL